MKHLKQFIGYCICAFICIQCTHHEGNINNGNIVEKEITNHNPEATIELQQKIIPIDTLALTKQKLLAEPSIRNSSFNSHLASHEKTIPFSLANNFTPTTNQELFSTKDLTISPNQLIVKESKPIPIKEPYYKDNSIYDIQYLNLKKDIGFSSIWYSIEDSSGNLWFSSYFEGIAKYNGETATIYSEAQGLPKNAVWTMLEDSKGNIWFGHVKGGLTMFDGKSFINYSETNGFLSNTVWSILEDKKGNLWFGTDNGIAKYNGETFSYITEENGLSGNRVLSMTEDNQGYLWFGTIGKGISFLKDQKIYTYDQNKVLFEKNITTLLSGSNNKLWIGTNGDGLFLYTDNLLTQYTTKNGLINNGIRGLTEDKNGQLWIASHNGLCSYYDNHFTHFTTAHGLASNETSTILLDHQGNLIATSQNFDIFKFNLNSFEHITTEQHIPNNHIYVIYEDSKKQLWFGTNGGGIYRFDGINYHLYNKDQGFTSSVITRIIEDHRGNMWIGTTTDGLYKFDGSNFTNYNTNNGLTSNNIFSIMEDHEHQIWFSSARGGLSKLQNNQITNYTISEDPEQNTVFNIFEDSKHRIWFSTEHLGIGKLQDNAFTFYTKTNGLKDNFTWSIIEDHQKNIWFGHAKGISRYDGQQFKPIIFNNELDNRRIIALTEDHNHTIWITTTNGVYSIIYDEKLVNAIDDVFKVDNHKAFMVSYGEYDGLKSLNFFEDSALIDSNNNLWLGSSSSLVKLNLNRHIEHFGNTTPKMQLNSLEINDQFIDFRNITYDSLPEHKKLIRNLSKEVYDYKSFENLPNSLVLPHNYNQIQFNFSAIDRSSSTDIVYSYKIEGLDEHWSLPNNTSNALYRNIPYGSYTFKVKAIGKSKQWSNIVNYPFIITPPWWLSNWAMFIYIMLFISLIVLSFRIYSYRMRQQQKHLEKLITERTSTITQQKEELSLAYNDLEIERNKMELKALLNQINPHFIFNALNSIQKFILFNDTKSSLDYFNKFGALIRALLEHSNTTYVTLDEEIDVLKNYVSLESLRFDKPIDLIFETNDINTYNVQIPPMFIQPLIENAIVHGLTQKNDDRRIVISFKEKKDSITCTVTDNGTGRNSTNINYNKTSGLSITQKRLNSVWNQLKDIQEIYFNDLPTGTAVHIKLPKKL